MSELKAYLVSVRTQDMAPNSWLTDWRPALSKSEARRDALLRKGVFDVRVEETGQLWVDLLAKMAGG